MTHKNVIEESYVLKKLEDNKSIKHKRGSNEYIFDYNYQWRNIYNQHQRLAIRSVKLWKSPRHIFIDEIPLIRQATEEELILKPKPPCIDSKGFWHEVIDVMGTITGTTLEDIKKLEPTKQYIKIKYNILTKTLAFEALNDWRIDMAALNERKERDKTETDPLKLQESEDFRAITGKKFADGIPAMAQQGDTNAKVLLFYNVWDREDVHVYASFSDLSTDGFLGVSNEQFIPPKQYPVNNNDQKFKLFLYDKLDRPIELAVDGKDTLIVEAMMIAYT